MESLGLWRVAPGGGVCCDIRYRKILTSVLAECLAGCLENEYHRVSEFGPGNSASQCGHWEAK